MNRVLCLAALALTGCNTFREPRQAREGPLRITVDGVDQVLVLTDQDAGEWRTVELWSFGVPDMKVRWRRELPSRKYASRYEGTLLGVSAGIAWVFSDGVHGVAVADGSLRWPAEALRKKNPALAELWPKEQKFFELKNGLVFTAADANRYRIDPSNGEARPAASGAGSRGGDVAPAYYTPSATYSFQARGGLFGDQWLGLADEQDMTVLQTQHATPGLDASGARRYQIWRAEVKSDATSTERDYLATYVWKRALVNLRPAGAEHVFLKAGLLQDSLTRTVVRLRDPEGALVLYHDRIDEDAHLQLARLTTAGEVKWKTALPLSLLQSVMPGDRVLVLKGLQYDRNRPKGSDPHHTGRSQVVSVELAGGKVEWVDVAAKR